MEINYNVAKRLYELGHETTVYSSKIVDPGAAREFETFSSVQPLFTLNPYYNGLQEDKIAGELIAYNRLSVSQAEELSKVANSDCWIWPTLLASELNACAFANSNVPVAGCIHESTSLIGQSDVYWRNAFLNCKNKGFLLNIGVLEPKLLNEYKPLAANCAQLSVFPIPYEAKGINAPKRKLRTIGFFGAQRAGKGIHLVLDLAKELAGMGYKVVIHDSSEQLNAAEDKNIEFLGYVENLGYEISRCDLVVLPYDPVKYQTKGSGILWESLAAAVPVVGPSKAAIGDLIEKSGAGAVFNHYDIGSILEAIEMAAKNYLSISNNAYDFALSWPLSNGVNRFVGALLEVVEH